MEAGVVLVIWIVVGIPAATITINSRVCYPKDAGNLEVVTFVDATTFKGADEFPLTAS